MNRIGKVLGAGILTPALTGAPHAAGASPSTDVAAQNLSEGVEAARHPDAAKQLLQEDIFSLSQPEKLKLGGDRIRLSEGVVKKKGGKGNANKTIANWTKQYCKPPGTGREAAPGGHPDAGKQFLSIFDCHTHKGCEPTINRRC